MEPFLERPGRPPTAPAVVSRVVRCPTVPKKKLSAFQKFRKATIRQHVRDQLRIKEQKKRATKRAADNDLVEKWRALRRAGVYDSKDRPAKKYLTKSRRAEINRKFNKVQNLGKYENGNVLRPLHRAEYEIKKPVFDEYGRIKEIKTRTKVKYELDKTHFQVLKKKAKKAPAGSLKTPEGLIVPKSPDQKVRINKDGKVEITEKKGAAKTQFTQEPLSGPAEFIALMEDIRTGRLKFGKKEGLALWSNGVRKSYYGADVMNLAKRLERYLAKKGVRNFDDWSSNSEIAHIRRH